MGFSTNEFTIAVWAKPMRNNTAQTLAFFKSAGGWCLHFLLMMSDGHISANLWNGARKSTNGTILPLNKWTHIGYTFSSANGIRLYLNGTQYSTTGSFAYAAANKPLKLLLGSSSGLLGCSPMDGSPFTGALDEFYIFRRELTASEILALANQ